MTEQLFDLAKDPHELRELSADPAYVATMELWRKRMVETLVERGEEWVKDGKLVVNEIDTPLNQNYPN